MRQRIGIAMPQAQIALEHIADFTVPGESALPDHLEELVEGLPRTGLDVPELRLGSLVDPAVGRGHPVRKGAREPMNPARTT